MMTLSIRQPWAFLVASGVKDCENRTWRTDYRGPLLIHAGRTVAAAAMADMRRELQPDERVELERAVAITGAIIGRVTLVNCTRAVRSEWHEAGLWGWYVTDAVLFDRPVPWRGQLHLFDVPEEAVKGAAAMVAALEHVGGGAL